MPEESKSRDRSGYARVGRIVAPHGIRGEVRVLPSTDFPAERFRPGRTLYLAGPQASNPDASDLRPLEVVRARTSGAVYLLAFRGIGDRNAAEALRGRDLYVRRAERSALPEGTYYVDEVVGLRVLDEAGREIGVVSEVLPYAANDVWVVSRPGRPDLLLPFIAEVVREVSPAEGVVRVRLLPGLPGLDDEEARES
ncbi:MAG: 16S rRNA processing protein RimM [Brockia lithotrophica]|uniref:Ribosome maturation factor RimM n=1 Tax=Brockia lithotrophica TaxID=933949 RepID=A0A2T5G925_9BACL|nr:ribosome maturation factor RimM [Brockia lithotrophica]PTQ52691.1 MAG: 16S rRNA processing protein RimM [Brockia lithotrophica]